MNKPYEPIAIVGIACRFPGADDISGYWSVLENGQSPLKSIPASRWNNKNYFDNNEQAPGKIYVNHGYFLDAVDQFDPQFFRISPREAEYIDPQQRLLLEVSWEALMNASISPDSIDHSNTGVFIGLMNHDYANLITRHADSVDNNFLAGIGNSSHSAAGRIAYTFGLYGPCATIDTACSSSLVALHQACRALQFNECDLALSGAVNLILDPDLMISMCNGKVLARDGRCKTFDDTADGYGRGEGCGVIILKRLADAIRDNNTVLAVIKGSAINQNGPGNGLTVPNGEAQRRIMQQVMHIANIKPHTVSYIEAHGSATQLGDLIEMNSILATYGNNRHPDNPLYIGSAKTNIGHLEAASGMAGLMKIILSLHYDIIPKHLHLQQLNRNFNFDQASIRIPDQNQPWSREGKTRIATINSFGISGTNAHFIIEDYPESKLNMSRQHPYKRKRYWLASLDAVSSLRSMNNKPASVVDSDGIIKHIHLESATDLEKHAYLQDHKMFASCIYPAAGFIQHGMQLRDTLFARDEYKNRAIVLSNVNLQRAFILSASTQNLLSIEAVKSPSDIRYQVTLSEVAKTTHQNDITTSAFCKYDLSTIENNVLNKKLDINTIKNSLTPVIHFEKLYEDLNSLGLDYGQGMRAIKNIWNTKYEVLAEIGMQERNGLTTAERNIVLIDSALQSVALMQVEQHLRSGHAHAYLPLGIKQMTWVKNLPQSIYVYFKLPETRLAHEILEVDLQIHDQFGNLIADIAGLCLKQTDSTAIAATTGVKQQSCYYQEHWELASFQKTRSVHSKRWLIIGSDQHFGSHLQAELEKLGNVAILVNYDFDLTTLSDECNAKFNQLHGIVYLGFEFMEAHSDTLDVINPDRIDHYLKVVNKGLFRLIKALFTAIHKPDLMVVTRGARIVSNEDRLDPVQATLWGILQSARHEYSGLRLHGIDLDTIENDIAIHSRQLINEMSVHDNEQQIAIRHGNRHVPRLINAQRLSQSNVNTQYSAGTYIVTGGFGGLGVKMIEYLFTQGIKNIITISRNLPDAEMQKQIASWEQQGLHIHACQANLAEMNELKSVLTNLKMNKPDLLPIKGIIHSAGITKDRMMINLHWEDYVDVYAAKIAGTLNLHALTISEQIDDFVLFSSIASVVGAVGQSNYAAANAFMDIFSHYRASLNLPSLSINWGPWKEAGMAKDLVAMHASKGIHALSPEIGVNLLHRIIHRRDLSQVMIADLHADHFIPSLPIYLQPQFATITPNDSATDRKLLNANGTMNHATINNAIISAIKSVLGYTQEHEFNDTDNFFDLGMDSLFAIQFNEKLKNNLDNKVDIPMVAIFQHPTIAALNAYLQKSSQVN